MEQNDKPKKQPWAVLRGHVLHIDVGSGCSVLEILDLTGVVAEHHIRGEYTMFRLLFEDSRSWSLVVPAPIDAEFARVVISKAMQAAKNRAPFTKKLEFVKSITQGIVVHTDTSLHHVRRILPDRCSVQQISRGVCSVSIHSDAPEVFKVRTLGSKEEIMTRIEEAFRL